MIVPDPGDEPAHAPALQLLGYQLTIREPSWYGHRMLRLDSPAVNLHVFGPRAPEPARHALFRDWLTTNTRDRNAYATAKQAAALRATLVADYNANKESTVREIYVRIFHTLESRR